MDVDFLPGRDRMGSVSVESLFPLLHIHLTYSLQFETIVGRHQMIYCWGISRER